MREEQISRMDEEEQKFWRNMRDMEERECKNKRWTGFPCYQNNCPKYGTDDCLHPEKAGFPAQRY